MVQYFILATFPHDYHISPPGPWCVHYMHYMTNNPKATINVFGMFNWIMKEGWPHIPRKQSKEDATEEASISNIANKASRRKLFKLFFRSPVRNKTNIFLKLSPTILALIMNVPPIMAVPFANYKYNYLNVMITKIRFYTFDSWWRYV